MTTAVPRLGVTFIPTIEPEKLKDFARVAEDSGLDEIWLWEDCFKESGVAAAAAALAWTERIHVGSVASRCAMSRSPRWRSPRSLGCFPVE
jgi:alkanesulfonate monooxygenase SsuD/methylene tetrahydromethanopterin reductase-like flavin-dependent oxidoreductase (luciferase family)